MRQALAPISQGPRYRFWWSSWEIAAEQGVVGVLLALRSPPGRVTEQRPDTERRCPSYATFDYVWCRGLMPKPRGSPSMNCGQHGQMRHRLRAYLTVIYRACCAGLKLRLACRATRAVGWPQTAGCCWVTQWMPPPPSARLLMVSWTTSRPGYRPAARDRAVSSADRSPNLGMSTAPLHTYQLT
jgi:hypothetical protein